MYGDARMRRMLASDNAFWTGRNDSLSRPFIHNNNITRIFSCKPIFLPHPSRRPAASTRC